MGCFIAPMTEAVVATVVSKKLKSKEKHLEAETVTLEENGELTKYQSISLSRKVSWLSKMLWGGSALLAIEHVWHGEVVPWAPFLTAMSTKQSTVEMLTEIGTVGVSMCFMVTAVWGAAVYAVHAKQKKIFGKKEVD